MLVAVRESSAAAARGALQELLPLVQAAVDASVRAADTPRGVDSASLAAALEATLPAALSSPVADSLAPALEASLRASLLPPMEQATCGRRLGRISAASPSLPRPRLGPVSAPSRPRLGPVCCRAAAVWWSLGDRARPRAAVGGGGVGAGGGGGAAGCGGGGGAARRLRRHPPPGLPARVDTDVRAAPRGLHERHRAGHERALGRGSAPPRARPAAREEPLL